MDTEAVIQTTEELLRISSVSHDEKAIGDWLEQRLAARQPHSLIRASHSLCFAMRPPDPAKKTLMLLGHTDTVPQFSENPVRREDDQLFGLGASDMKAADAVLLHAIEANREREARYNLVGCLYACEETAFLESEMPLIYAAAKDWFDRIDLAVCMEPTDNQIELGCLGTCHAQVTFEGKRAHSARPWQGENAIHKATPFLSRLVAIEPEEHIFHDLSFFEVLNVTMLDSKGARNVIPDNFMLNVNYRFSPDKDEAAVRARLDALIADDATYELIDFCPAGRVCGDNQLLQDLTDAAGHPEVRAKQAWTDVGRLSNLGIDAVNWGCGTTTQAHQEGEWVSIGEIEKAVNITERWLYGS